MPRKTSVVKTGFKGFDGLAGGLRGSELLCIASRPAQGKTALALGMAARLALAKKPRPVLFFSLGMSRARVMRRLLAARSRVPLDRLRAGTFTGSRLKDIARASRTLDEAPLRIVDGCRDLEEIARISRRLASKLRSEGRRLGLIVIDSLQRIGGEEGASALSAAEELKRLAVETDASMLLVSQVGRSAAGIDADEDRPRLSDRINGPGGAKGAKASELARLCDRLAFLRRGSGWWPPGAAGRAPARARKGDVWLLGGKTYLGGKLVRRDGEPVGPVEVEIILAKNARGRTGTASLKFDRETSRFLRG